MSQSSGTDNSKPGSFKVSLHICCTTVKCIWSQQPEYFKHKGLGMIDINGVSCKLIDPSIYGTKNQLRLINHGKPTDPGCIKIPVTFTKNLLAHVPTTEMELCGGLKVKFSSQTLP
jgi:hypothetical protein